jgi:hypothetical protein
MSKNKGGRNAKKEPSVQSKKRVSDYQAGKKIATTVMVSTALKSKP